LNAWYNHVMSGDSHDGDVQYDPFSDAVMADPTTAYRELLAQCPVPHYDSFDPPFWSLTRHDDIAAAVRDTTTWSSLHGQGPRHTSQGGLFTDPPEHTAFRRLLQTAFTPRAVAELEPFIANLARELVDAVAADGRGDLHTAVAFPLPTITIATMMGVPPEDRDDFKRWSDASVARLGSQDPSAHDEDVAALYRYLAAHIDDRRSTIAAGGDPPNDLVTGLVRAEENGATLTPQEILGSCVQLLVGGNETTTSLITNALWRLMDRPELMAEVQGNLDLVDALIEESLRYDAPVLGLFRTTTCPVSMHGVDIPEGAKVQMLFGAANHDPAVFNTPEEFRLDRDPSEARRHLAFGAGPHFCLGASLARLEARHALRAILGTLPNLRADGPSERITPFLLWGRRTLPAAWDV